MKRHLVIVRAAAVSLIVAAAVAAIAGLNQDQIARAGGHGRTYHELTVSDPDGNLGQSVLHTPSVAPIRTEAVPCGGPGSGYTVITCNGKQHCVPFGTICCGDGTCAGAGSGYQCVRCGDGSFMCLPFGSTC